MLNKDGIKKTYTPWNDKKYVFYTIIHKKKLILKMLNIIKTLTSAYDNCTIIKTGFY